MVKRSRTVARRNNGGWKKTAMTVAATGAKYVGKYAKKYAKAYVKSKGKAQGKKNTSREDKNVWAQYAAGGVLKTLTVRKPSKLLKFYKYASNKSTYQNITIKGSVSTEGKQGCDTIGFPSASISVNAAATISNSFTTGVTLMPVGPQTLGVSVKFFLQSSRSTCKIVNQSPANGLVRLYHLVSKVTKVTFVSPETDWATGLVNESKYQSVNLGTAPLLSYPGSKPTTSKLFNINWKIINVKTAQMMPGQEITDVWTMVHNKVVDTQYFQTYSQVAGITQCIMMVYSGALGDSANSTSIGNISLAPLKLISSCEQIIETKALSPFQTSSYQDTTPYTTADANFYVVQDESGAVVNTQTATNYA